MDDKVKQLIECGNGFKRLAYSYKSTAEMIFEFESGEEADTDKRFLAFKNNLNMLSAKWDTLCKELEDETEKD